ncbi:uracil phosphoribosyltransferase-domain-containing protein [Staphylotrichum tortipilum]|uniref:Uracil phosphoribosyltransferase-domain-containing protein n=1 Tax=Staphylotrichum tortipilum TaxID=2831512 RepID=A0AAN6MRS7_9PEZI|nr:uracil phosphoribosyltransferase-domain-containing protein [Staphylotrichum longicolle]
MAVATSTHAPAFGPEAKPVVIGLYGVPGSGKTTMLRYLRSRLGEAEFSFHEGSETIAALVSGGLAEFQSATPEERTRLRETAIESIAEESNSGGRSAVVTGHFMFWLEGDEAGQTVHTQRDLDIYTHVIYLDTPPETIAIWRRLDASGKSELRRLCRNHGILFTAVSHPAPEMTVAALAMDFRRHTEEYNLVCAKAQLGAILDAHQSQDTLQTALVLDADRTLAAEDAGTLFCDMVTKSAPQHAENPKDDRSLKTLFASPLGYTYKAFRQAMLLCEEQSGHAEFDTTCQEVASLVALYPEMLSLLKQAGQPEHRDHVVAVVVTCGLRRVWELVLAKAGLSDTVKVVGGGRVLDKFVMTPEVKGALAAHLRDSHGLYVWAFGDSPLDLAMMHEAHQAVVVAGEAGSRRRTMDGALATAIAGSGLRARQWLAPSDAPARLNTGRLPLVRLGDAEFVNEVLRRRDAPSRIHHATNGNASKLLTTATRDARVSGPELRQAHGRVGWHLAISFLSDAIGVEEFDIPHVQGNMARGHRVRHERKTTIVALMRGGEPMALGVNDALPGAMFVHAKHPADLKLHHIRGQWAVLLVDSVVNSGKSIVDFVQRIRGVDRTISIVAVVGVVQAQSILLEGLLGQALHQDKALTLVALRFSENKFTGRGIIDTGNRLFNSTHLDSVHGGLELGG